MKAELVWHTLEFWSNLSPETYNKYIDHLYKIVPVVILMGGRATCDVPKKLYSESSRGRSIQYFVQQLQKEGKQKKFDLLLKDKDGNWQNYIDYKTALLRATHFFQKVT